MHAFPLFLSLFLHPAIVPNLLIINNRTQSTYQVWAMRNLKKLQVER